MVSKNTNFGSNILTVFASVIATRAVLKSRMGSGEDIKLRFARAFGINFLSGIAIILGFILLIVPGAMLFTRWTLAVPAMVAEDLGVNESLGRSRDLTDGNRWSILGLALALWIPFLLLFGLVLAIVAAFSGARAGDGLGGNLAANCLSSLALVANAVLWTECYVQLTDAGGHEHLAEVFA